MRTRPPIAVPTFATVPTPAAGTLILAANSRRFYALITNPSDTTIWIMFGSQNATGNGIPISPGGFSYEIDANNLWRGAIYAAHAGTGNKNVAVFEGQ